MNIIKYSEYLNIQEFVCIIIIPPKENKKKLFINRAYFIINYMETTWTKLGLENSLFNVILAPTGTRDQDTYYYNA